MLRFFPVMIAFAVLAACSDTPTETALEPIPGFRAAPATDPETLNWLDLLPDGEYERLAAMLASDVRPGLPLGHDESGPAAEQIGTFDTVAGLDGAHIRMPGYLIPLDSLQGRKSRRFLLVPYQGACIHEPPPPPNQVVYVLSQEPMPTERLWDAWWVEGVMLTERADTDLVGAAYTLHLARREPFSEPR